MPARAVWPGRLIQLRPQLVMGEIQGRYRGDLGEMPGRLIQLRPQLGEALRELVALCLGEMQARYRRDGGEVQARYRGDRAWRLSRCARRRLSLATTWLGLASGLGLRLG